MTEPFVTRVKTNLDGTLQMTQMLNGIMMTGDSLANRIVVEVYKGSEKIHIVKDPENHDPRIVGYFIRGDGATFEVDGTVNDDGEPEVVIPPAAYEVTGALSIAIRIMEEPIIVKDKNGVNVPTWKHRMVVAALSCFVQNTETDTIVDVYEVIPSLQELLEYLNTMDALNTTLDTYEKQRQANEKDRIRNETDRVTSHAERGDEMNAFFNQKGAANGLATLDEYGKVPSAQLPSYVDDVLEGYADPMDNPIETFYRTRTPSGSSYVYSDPYDPEKGKIYVDLETNKSYRWSGTVYILISNPEDIVETSISPEAPSANMVPTSAAVAEFVADWLNYKAISISALTIEPSTAEVGTTVNSIVLSYTLNKNATTMKLDNQPTDNDAGNKNATGTITRSGLSLTSNKTYKLYVEDTKPDGVHNNATKSVQLKFMNRVFYGVETIPSTLNSQFVRSLLYKPLDADGKVNFTLTTGSGEYMWYASKVACQFNVGGFDGGFEPAQMINVLNGGGVAEQYYVYRSTYPNLGAQSVIVK